MGRNARERAQAEAEYIRAHWGDRGNVPDQELACADPDDLFFTVLGVLTHVTYETKKGRHAPAELWEHEFRRPKPVLCYSPSSKRLLIAGGGYTVTDRGIER